MAGSFPDPPGRRVQYHIDGSFGYNWTGIGQPWTPLTQTQLNDLNDEDLTWDALSSPYLTAGSHKFGMVIVFSVPVNMGGLFWAASSLGVKTLEYSTDTITGSDGTWTNITSTYNPENGILGGAWRTNIQSLPVSGVKGIKMYSAETGNTATQAHIGGLHIYGTYSYDGLQLWNPSSDVIITGGELDWGDIRRGYTYYKTFRVKNSSALAANSITVSTSALTPASPTIQSQITYSIDGGAYASSINIGNVASGAISNVITAKYVVATNAQLSVWSGAFSAVAASWT